MRVDEARRDRAAAGVEPGEPAERIALRLERGLERGARPDRDDPTLPAGDDRRVRRVRAADVGGRQPADLALARARPGRRRRCVTTSAAPTISRPGVGSSLRHRG